MPDQLKQQFDNLQTALCNAKLAINTIALAYRQESLIGHVLNGYFLDLELIHGKMCTLEADYMCADIKGVAPPEPGCGKAALINFKIIPDESLPDNTFAVESAGKLHIFRLAKDGTPNLVAVVDPPEVRIFTRA